MSDSNSAYAISRLRARQEKLKAATRPLTRGEINIIPSKLRLAIDVAKVRLVDRKHNPFAGKNTVTDGNKIYWPGHPKDVSTSNVNARAHLMHELCHVWQYKKGRLSQLKYLWKKEYKHYDYSFDEKKSFLDYRIEQQASMVGDWYLRSRNTKPIHALNPQPSFVQLDKVICFD